MVNDVVDFAEIGDAVKRSFGAMDNARQLVKMVK